MIIKKLFCVAIGVVASIYTVKGQSEEHHLSDTLATEETVNLYQNLFEISQNGFMFGHQDTDAYGIGWWAKKANSNVKEVSGHYPAVHGWDLGNIDGKFNLDTVDFKKMKRWIKANYKRGAINTVSWHVRNFVTGTNAWDITPSIKTVLPGGSNHDDFLRKLDMVADFFKDCKVGSTYIPIIFRPWHEHNGDWFWWGKGNADEKDYITLWRFTVDYLRNKKDIHHLIYAFSPDRSRMNIDSAAQDAYLYGYPGDDYVDVLGLDNYWDVGHSANQDDSTVQKKQFIKSLELVTAIAKEKGKLAALTETGSAGIQNPKWFTEVILNPIKAHEQSIDIAWLLVWRNRFKESAMAPYPGSPSASDFNKFESDSTTIFEDDLENIYK